MTTFSSPGTDLRARQRFALNPLTVLILNAFVLGPGALLAQDAHADEEVQFNDVFLPQDSRSLDLSPYQKGNPVLPGEYRADVAVNGRLVTRQDIRIEAETDGSSPVVCVNKAVLEMIGVDLRRLTPEATVELESGKQCLELARLIDGATAAFSPSTQLLDISIPQIALRRDARNAVSPELWDRGVTAAMLSYTLNANHNQTRTGNYDTAYLGLNAGFNLGDWRLRHNGSLNWQKDSGQTYQTLNTYAQRDITSLKSQLTVGEANTSGEIFDTLAYRGVQLGTDDRMLPESQRGYAPVIRGIARTSARVAVRQAGNLLYETTVAPGAFVIDDLYSTGYGGDLDVTVYEADGSEQRFIVPFAATAQLLRPGTSRFNLTAGQTRNNYISRQAKVVQGTYQRGLSNLFTGYGGVQASDDYRATLGGLALSTPIGALAADVTHAQTQLRSGSSSGQSLRLTYSKNILSTGSNFALAATRFSTEGYLDFSNAVQLLAAERDGLDTSLYGRPRSRLTLSANQSLGGWGQVAFSGFTQNYWNLPGSDVQYQLSYNKQVNQVSYGISANRSRAGLGGMQNSMLFTVSLPLGFGDSINRPQLSARVMRDTGGSVSQQATVSGTAGQDRQYSYSATAGHDGASASNSTALNGQYTGSKAIVGGTLNNGQGYNSLSLNASGSVVAHPSGVTFTPYRGDTMAVVSAPGAAGAKVVGYPGLKLDGRGNAVVPYLRPYELNEVAIDPVGTSLDVELSETSQQVAPRAGAVVALKYGTRTGEVLLLNVSLADGSTLPFGASVVDDRGVSVGMVGQGGQLYARIKENAHRLLISWGTQANQQCALTLPAGKRDGQQLRQVDAVCTPDPVAAVAAR
ncbi:MAG: fimbrial biogenesis outer membrane usher protein [Pseudomonas sp.]|jgi:outer membrane usher protein|uniref:fimbria/pilus outer membrane usher protein n=1 Tax=unclassified Pseudomonas TaxID=196821 RepID=UPI000B3FC10C|nr:MULTISPECIES: fimbria/pilus outer membrane usher protein [unclassified Pseudomonas]MDP9030580.1 fimbrial biogenesis outer membrane usher protein [Pseudomonadota bacterium]MDE1907815.1 fimbrial biogenesis outer membrane usher protein [Pseudomonas sp.]MDE2189513.1 fimbrial biogenesis outer membrane usher protein [Pseudomonas sp.]MDE2558368.1 fimbrial biogenesis outer membrane usher protein [Pseudomonas sp.]MDP9218403.1 fimbrial biogenesis outer membrane usher protein [Pseudomonadota bacterium